MPQTIERRWFPSSIMNDGPFYEIPQDGYTLEEVDVFGVVDGHEKLLLPKVNFYGTIGMKLMLTLFTDFCTSIKNPH